MRKTIHATPEIMKTNFLIPVSELIQCSAETGKELILRIFKEKLVQAIVRTSCTTIRDSVE